VSFCHACGKSIEPAWTFCGSCGVKIEIEPQTVAADGRPERAADSGTLLECPRCRKFHPADTVSCECGHMWAKPPQSGSTEKSAPILFAATTPGTSTPRSSMTRSVVSLALVAVTFGVAWIIGRQIDDRVRIGGDSLVQLVPAASETTPRIPAASGWTVETTTNPLTDTPVTTALRRVRSRRQEQVVPILGNPERTPETINATYELEFKFGINAPLELKYTIYDAVPTGIEFDGNGAYREVAMRFDDNEGVRRRWSISNEYPNVGSIRLGDPMAQLFALAREDRSGFETTTLNEIAGVRRRILIQGLRAADEFIEFPIDASFEPFRAQLQRRIGDANRQRQAQERGQEAAAALQREAAYAAQQAQYRREQEERLRQVEQEERLQAEARDVLRGQDEQRAASAIAQARSASALPPNSPPPAPPVPTGAAPAADGVYRPGGPVTNPRILREVKPQYTADAMRAKIQGTVLLECVVLPDGSVGRVDVVRSLDRTHGLDQEAIKAAKQWRFQPGTRSGEPVSVLVTIELTFTLK